jgi:leader peptidase (prepilin peptidase)/N-methyltransferase
VHISYRYFVVELLSGAVLLLFWLRFRFGVNFFIFSVLSVFLVIISGIDFMHRVIYDEINILLFIVGMLFSPFNTILDVNSAVHRAISGLLGSICGGVLFFIMSFLGSKIFRREALGGGDVKFIFALGTFLGVKLTLWTIFLGSLFGVFFSMIYWTARKVKMDTIPYAPFLSAGAAVAILLFS